jgi:hypothetical protein
MVIPKQLQIDVQIPTTILRLSFTKNKQTYVDTIDEWQFL